MAGKKIHLARAMMAVGAHRIISRNNPASLLVFNYHRLRLRGLAKPAKFDDGVFDTDFETFRRQMQWLKSTTTVLGEDTLLAMGSCRDLPRGRIYSAVTFDDGYIDCYKLVKPVLDDLGIRGIFFIPVEMIESRRLGWWDVAAFLLKNAKRRSIRIDDQFFDLKGDFVLSFRKILNLFKLERAERTEALLANLADACGIAPPMKDEQSAELMTWDQVRELQKGGHAIGSHAMSHRVLATLDPFVQKREIVDSRRELQAIIGSSISSFAYPVGGPQHFNADSLKFVREAGYEQAFTFNTGIASLPVIDRYRIPRESASSFAVLKAKVLLPGFMGIEARQAI